MKHGPRIPGQKNAEKFKSRNRGKLVEAVPFFSSSLPSCFSIDRGKETAVYLHLALLHFRLLLTGGEKGPPPPPNVGQSKQPRREEKKVLFTTPSLQQPLISHMTDALRSGEKEKKNFCLFIFRGRGEREKKRCREKVPQITYPIPRRPKIAAAAPGKKGRGAEGGLK